MKRSTFKLLVCSSALLLAPAATAATRPRYGGTLRVAAHEAIQNLDPAARESSAAKFQITQLLFDNLLVQAPNGLITGSLARTWSFDNPYLRWQFWLRPGVTFHNGEPLNAEAAAASLAHSIPGCEPHAVGDSVVFECDAPHPALAAQLAMPQNVVVRRSTDGKLEGSGPFVVADWQPSRRAVLNAAEDYWGGRPFVDSVEFTFDQNYRDQALALQLGRADVVELPAGQLAPSSSRATTSAPMQLVALVFSRTSPAVSDARVRSAFSMAIDR